MNSLPSAGVSSGLSPTSSVQMPRRRNASNHRRHTWSPQCIDDVPSEGPTEHSPRPQQKQPLPPQVLNGFSRQTTPALSNIVSDGWSRQTTPAVIFDIAESSGGWSRQTTPADGEYQEQTQVPCSQDSEGGKQSQKDIRVVHAADWKLAADAPTGAARAEALALGAAPAAGLGA